MSNISGLRKIFLLTLVQGATYYPIPRQGNLELLGEIDGGAKITSNPGISNFERKTHIVHFNEKKEKKIQIVEDINHKWLHS